MRMDFNVLWIEDQVARVKEQQKTLGRMLKAEGFALNVEFSPNISEAKKIISQDIYSDHIDLILMDYELKGGEKGDQGLIEVRATLPYKDIVFYSARTQNLRELLIKSGVQGVYLSDRTLLPDIAYGVFENLVKKVLDIEHSRGIVMGATSDIDQTINDSLLSIFVNLNEEEKNHVMSLIMDKLEEKKKDFEALMIRLKSASELSTVFEAHGTYTSSDRLILLRKILKLKNIHSDKQKSLIEYGDKAIPKRNTLAHVTVQRNGFSRKIFDNRNIEITSDEMKKIRLLILNHREVFQSILTELTSET